MRYPRNPGISPAHPRRAEGAASKPGGAGEKTAAVTLRKHSETYANIRPSASSRGPLHPNVGAVSTWW